MGKRIGLLLGVFSSLFLSAITALGEGSMSTTNSPLKNPANVNIVADMPERSAAGESIVIKLILKNESDEDVLYVDSYEYRDYAITIRDSSDVAVPMTKFGQVMGKPGRYYRYIVKKLSPGKNVVVCLNIARLFDLTIADKYTVSVVRTINEGLPGKERQVSMETTLVVQEPK
jgi:hypothetical protein